MISLAELALVERSVAKSVGLEQLPDRRRGSLSCGLWEVVAYRLLEQGKTSGDVASVLDVSRRTVNRWRAQRRSRVAGGGP